MFSFNKIISTLIFTDIAIFTGWGLIAPIFSIFILKNIEGGDVQVAGVAAGIYFLVRSVAQIPIGRYLDRRKGEDDDFWFMIAGASVVTAVPLGYLFADASWHIYLLQACYGLGAAMYGPPWGGIFTRHMDRGKEARTWSVETSGIMMGAGIAGIIGGTIAEMVGFQVLFIFVSLMNALGVVGYFFIRDSLAPKGQTITFPKQ